MSKLIAASALVLAFLVLPASSLAAPLPEGSDPVLTISPSPALLPTTTVGNQSQPIEFELHNESAEEAAIEKVSLGGEEVGEFGLGANNCATLQPGDHCSASVSFKPGSIGVKKATLQVSFAGGRPEQSFEVSGTSAPAHLRFLPSSYDFGLQPIHAESQRTVIQIENDGAAATQLNSLSFTGGNSNGFWFGNSDCYGRWMQPGETCSAEVYFSPNEAGPYAIQLQASAGGENFTANLSGEGGQAIVSAAPNPADFDAATVGSTSATQAIVISNSGNVPTAFFIGIVAGGDSGSFQLVDENCTGAELMPSSSCTAHVRFRPQDAGPKAAYLAFFGDSEGGAMVGLKGEGVAAAVTLVPSAFDFGAQVAGRKSAGHDFAVRNDGSTGLDLGAVSIVGADLDQFVLAGDECTGEALAPGAECLVRVRFAPDGPGAKTAKLRVGSDAGAFAAALAGEGTGSGSAPVAGSGLPPAGPGANPADQLRPPRPARKGRRRRFVRGETLVAGRVQRPRRVFPPSAIPR